MKFAPWNPADEQVDPLTLPLKHPLRRRAGWQLLADFWARKENYWPEQARAELWICHETLAKYDLAIAEVQLERANDRLVELGQA